MKLTEAAMKRTAFLQAVLLCAASTWILPHDAEASDHDQNVIQSAASAPILGSGFPPSDRGRASSIDAASAPVDELGRGVSGRERATLLIGRKKAPYFCNRSLTAENPNITRAI